MIKVHHARRSRSVRVVWLLEELGLPYELHILGELPDECVSLSQYSAHLEQRPAYPLAWS